MTGPNRLRPIKICFVAPKAYPIFNPDEGDYFGGAEVDLYYLATELAKDKFFHVSYIVADYGQQEIETIEGVRIIKSLNFKKNPLSGAVKIWRAMRKANADIYMLKTASPGTPLVAFFCRWHKKAFVYRTAHQRECDGTYLKQHFFLGRAFAWSLHQAKILFTQNAADAENLSATISVCSKVIPNGHRLPQLNQKRRDTILWVGRDADFKKPQRFLELAQMMPTHHFTMICQTLTHAQTYTNLVAQAAQLSNLQFIPHVPFNQVDSYFQQARVFVNTSDAEGFPNTFIQACTAGTPILSLNVNPDGFLDEFNCGICCNNDMELLCNSLKYLLEQERYLQLGCNARKYAEEHHDIKKIAEQYKQLLKQVVEKDIESA